MTYEERRRRLALAFMTPEGTRTLYFDLGLRAPLWLAMSRWGRIRQFQRVARGEVVARP